MPNKLCFFLSFFLSLVGSKSLFKTTPYKHAYVWSLMVSHSHSPFFFFFFLIVNGSFVTQTQRSMKQIQISFLLLCNFKIGMMRSGRLLAEESPQSLLESHNLTSLEDVFLKLCMKDVTSSPPSTPSTVPTSVASTPIVTDKPQRRQERQQEFDNGQDNPVFEQQTEEINGNEQVMNARN